VSSSSPSRSPNSTDTLVAKASVMLSIFTTGVGALSAPCVATAPLVLLASLQGQRPV
jgi:hypothetical protein